MVIKGRIRGHGRGLASYLLTQGENEWVQVLDVDGVSNPGEQDLRDLLGDFSLNEKLTRSRQGVYHCMINPPDGESVEFTNEQWLEAAQILAEETGFAEQRRAIVLHRKHGRIHAHVAFERYCHDKGKMIPIDHNYKKHDKARLRMEQHFDLLPTSEKNVRRPVMLKELTSLWQSTPDGKAFVKVARQNGYWITRREGRAPFWVMDDTGRSFNLVRQLEGCRLKEVRAKLAETTLIDEYKARELIRTKQKATLPLKQKEEGKAFMQNLEKIKNRQRNQQLRLR